MSPLSDGSDRSPASFSLGGGTWVPISNDAATFDLSSSRHNAPFLFRLRGQYTLFHVAVSGGMCREGRGRCTTLLDIQVNTYAQLIVEEAVASTTCQHHGSLEVPRSFNPPSIHPWQHRALNASATSVYSRTGSTPISTR